MLSVIQSFAVLFVRGVPARVTLPSVTDNGAKSIGPVTCDAINSFATFFARKFTSCTLFQGSNALFKATVSGPQIFKARKKFFHQFFPMVGSYLQNPLYHRGFGCQGS